MFATLWRALVLHRLSQRGSDMATRPDVRSLPTRPIIGGAHFEDGASEIEVVDPANRGHLTEVPDVGREGVDRAVAAAKSAFPAWGKLEPRLRASYLLDLAGAIERNTDRISELESLDVGKPIAMVPAEVASAVDKVRFYAGAARQLSGLAANEYRAPLTSFIRREPVGVVGAITPWNYPFAMAIWKIGPALAAGNTVVLKPSPESPLSTLFLGELAAEVLPDGVLNVVTGGAETGLAMVEHPGVDMISLTGGTATGKAVMAAAASTVKRLQLELGGNAAVLVFDDADLDKLRDAYFMAAFRNTGQDCHAASRVYASPGIKDDVVRVISEVAASTPIGDPFDERTRVGPMVSQAQNERVSQLVDRALSAPHISRVTATSCPDGGYYYPLTVLDGARHEDEISQSEIFGPVVTVSTFADEGEAIARANGVSQGLAASVWTGSIDRALRVSQDLQAGTIWVNTHGQTVAEMPFGGVKESGFGSDLSIYALEQHTTLKSINIHATRDE
jgi:aminobutyraldehyde dehydrogenase